MISQTDAIGVVLENSKAVRLIRRARNRSDRFDEFCRSVAATITTFHAKTIEISQTDPEDIKTEFQNHSLRELFHKYAADWYKSALAVYTDSSIKTNVDILSYWLQQSSLYKWATRSPNPTILTIDLLDTASIRWLWELISDR